MVWNSTFVAYETILSNVNKKKTPAPRTRCECGKEIFVAQLEKHRNTMFHRMLMMKKHPGIVLNVPREDTTMHGL